MPPPCVRQDELVDQMDISGSLEDLQDQNVIVYLLRVFRNKYYSKVRSWPRCRTLVEPASRHAACGAATEGHFAYHRLGVEAHLACSCNPLPHVCWSALDCADISGGRAILPHLPLQRRANQAGACAIRQPLRVMSDVRYPLSGFAAMALLL